jgi:hypothetical protein
VQCLGLLFSLVGAPPEPPPMLVAAITNLHRLNLFLAGKLVFSVSWW